MLDLLKQILKEKNNRKYLISLFQKEVWNNENANEILSELAYDFNFYEPNEKLRIEDSSYYGDEKLELEITAAINNLKNAPNG